MVGCAWLGRVAAEQYSTYVEFYSGTSGHGPRPRPRTRRRGHHRQRGLSRTHERRRRHGTSAATRQRSPHGGIPRRPNRNRHHRANHLRRPTIGRSWLPVIDLRRDGRRTIVLLVLRIRHLDSKGSGCHSEPRRQWRMSSRPSRALQRPSGAFIEIHHTRSGGHRPSKIGCPADDVAEPEQAAKRGDRPHFSSISVRLLDSSDGARVHFSLIVIRGNNLPPLMEANLLWLVRHTS